MRYENDYLQVEKWFKTIDGNALFCSGSYGDLFLGIDASIKNNLSLIYWSKKSTEKISQKIIDSFNIKSHIIKTGIEIWKNQETHEFISKLKSLLSGKAFRTHNNNNLNLPFVKWQPNKKCNEYDSFKDYKIDLPEKYILICPAGSASGFKMKRHFSNDEIDNLLKILKEHKKEPILVGNDLQLRKYDRMKKTKWLQFEKFNGKDITIKHFLQAVRGSEFVISPDTSLKTISAIMHVTTYVLKNRNQYGEPTEGIWDDVFLNEKKWTSMSCLTYDQIIKKIKEKKIIKII